MQSLTGREKILNSVTVVAAWAVCVGACLVNSLAVRKDAYSAYYLAATLGLAAAFALILTVMCVYVSRFRRSLLTNPKMNAALFAILAVGFTVDTLLGSVNAYAVPITFAAMLACSFFDSRVSFVLNAFLTVMLALSGIVYDYVLGISVDLLTEAAVLTAGFLIGTLISFLLRRNVSRMSFILLGVLLNAAGILIILLFLAFAPGAISAAPVRYAFLAIFVFGPVLLCLMLQPLFERVFNVTSNFRLVELTDPNHPLLRRLAEEAPGTFNHSLTVANLVETCANRIGENVYMARAAAYYHDIGKIMNPGMFAENQSDHNIHDELTPEVSAEVIRNHTVYGAQLCKENRIPCEIAQIAREHHGTTVIAYFYNKAREMTDGREVDVKEFSYAGPIPSTKIAALVMICDSCEAAIRAMNDHDAEAVDKLVTEIVNARLRAGQFDNCPITMQDLHAVRKTIVNAICGLYHKRIAYPKADEE